MKIIIITGLILVGLGFFAFKIYRGRRRKLIMANSAVSRVFDMSSKREIR